MKKRKRTLAAGAMLLAAAVSLAGCGLGAVDEPGNNLPGVSEEMKSSERLLGKGGAAAGEIMGDFEKVSLTWNSEDVELLSLPQSRLLNEELNLHIVGLEKGVYVIPWSPLYAYDGRQLCFIKRVEKENGQWETGIYRHWFEDPFAAGPGRGNTSTSSSSKLTGTVRWKLRPLAVRMAMSAY